MTTLLDTFKCELSYEGRTIDEIERVVFYDKYDLDLKKTFELMEDLGDRAPELIDIVFYGKDFKVTHTYDFKDCESVFSVISLKKPRKTKVYDPYSLVDTVYDDDFKMPVPFKTEKYKVREAKEDVKRKAEYEKAKREADAKQKAELDELLDKMRAMKTEPLPDYTIYSKFGGAYAVVPERLIRESQGVLLSKALRDKLPEEYKYVVDYVGYAGYEPDDTLPKLFGRYTKQTKDTYPGYMQEFFEKAISEKLIFPILGISAQSSYDFTFTATELMKKIISYLK